MNDILIKEILTYLDCSPGPPTLRYLNRLIYAYIRKVPWESVSRIIKRYTTRSTQSCPRLPEEFWQDAIQWGLGGTCFESCFAFYSLLIALGYEGYLTVNDMGTSRLCHAAIVLLLSGYKYLVDVTIPLHSAVRFSQLKTTRRQTPFLNYTVYPVQANVYEVERSHHPNRNAFTLIDDPVSLTDYRNILENDYTEMGLFLNRVVMNKVIGTKTYRFFSDQKPFRLESFNRAGKYEYFLQPSILARTLAEKFHMPEDKISAALTYIEN